MVKYSATPRGRFTLKDWDSEYKIFFDAAKNLGIDYGGAAVEKLLGIWVAWNSGDQPLPDDLRDFVRSLCGPNAYALIKAYRIKHGLE